MDRLQRRALLKVVREQFRLEWRGIHGLAHWARVRLNGLSMAQVRYSGREGMKEMLRVQGRATGLIVHCQGPCFATSAFTASTSSPSM